MLPSLRKLSAHAFHSCASSLRTSAALPPFALARFEASCRAGTLLSSAATFSRADFLDAGAAMVSSPSFSAMASTATALGLRKAFIPTCFIAGLAVAVGDGVAFAAEASAVSAVLSTIASSASLSTRAAAGALEVVGAAAFGAGPMSAVSGLSASSAATSARPLSTTHMGSTPLSVVSKIVGARRAVLSGSRHLCSGQPAHFRETVPPHSTHCKMSLANPSRPSLTHIRRDALACASSASRSNEIEEIAASSRGPVRSACASVASLTIGAVLVTPLDVINPPAGERGSAGDERPASVLFLCLRTGEAPRAPSRALLPPPLFFIDATPLVPATAPGSGTARSKA